MERERMISAAWTALLLGALLIMVDIIQGISVAHAASYEVSG